MSRYAIDALLRPPVELWSVVVALAAAVAGMSMNRWLVRTLREAVGKR